jgi:hypothetical protein
MTVLCTADINELDLDMTLKAMGIVEILLAKEQLAKFREFYRELRGSWSASERLPAKRMEAMELQRTLFQKHFGWSLEQMDDLFRERFGR